MPRQFGLKGRLILRRLGILAREDLAKRWLVPRVEHLLAHYTVLSSSAAEDATCLDSFYKLKQRFLNFKNQKYLKEKDHFIALSNDQSPKFMVIACSDSRVCPSNILGFQPGEALMIRNVANIVPPSEHGVTETNAALEFAVSTLGVEHLFVIGHSSCAGIQALLRMRDDQNSSLIEKWIANANAAKLRTKTCSANTSFESQCRYCEKESINQSLINLMDYPWIESRVARGFLSVHGGYYDFSNCTFEKWTLDYMKNGSFTWRDYQLWT